MNIQNQNNSPTLASLGKFVVSRVIKEEFFTLSVYVGSLFSVECTITTTLYRDVVSK
jgi:hypothetical protein